MQSFALLSLLASAAFALDAKAGTAPTYGFDTVQHPAKDEVVKAGSTFTIQWETPSKYDGEKVTINLIGGSSPDTQTKMGEVASGIDNSDGSYSWTVKSSLGKDKVYGLQLINEKDNSIWQYSDHFSISQSSGGNGGDDSDSKSTATGDNSSATETDKDTGSKSTSTATKTGDDNDSTATETETSAPKTTETDSSASETSAAATETTLTTVPSKSTDASATGTTETPSSTTSAATQTNAAGVLGSSNMLALGGVAAALFAL